MRAAPLIVLVLAVLVSGCGGSGEPLTTPVPSRAESTAILRAAWEHNPDCRHPKGASRWACSVGSVGSYRCQGVVTGRGWSVDCSKPGSSVSFTVPRG